MKLISITLLTLATVPLFASELSMVNSDDIEFLSRVEMNIEANTPHEDVIEHYAVPYTGPSNMDEVDPNTLHGKVMAGYQGWHRAAGDRAPLAWDMWGMGELGEQDARFDFWPDMSEYSEEEKYETPFKHTDGSPAYLYSAYNRKTVFRHFQWMKDYGIDGVFPQRFTGYLIDPNEPMTAPRNKSRIGTLSHVREAANYYGRSYAVMYDVHCGKADWEKILHDWDILKNKMKLTDDPAYQKHDGKFVIAIWGFLKPDRRFDLVRILVQHSGRHVVGDHTAAGFTLGQGRKLKPAAVVDLPVFFALFGDFVHPVVGFRKLRRIFLVGLLGSADVVNAAGQTV